MRAYIIRRLLILIPTLFAVATMVFFLIRIMPGDVIDVMQGVVGDVELDRAQLEHALGLDAPIYIQYGRWIGVIPQMDGKISGLFQGSLGMSWWRGVPVVDELRNKWPVTLELGLMAILISQLIALPIGIYSALRQDKWGDYLGRSFAILCMSVPQFWLATMVILFPALWWGYMPPIMMVKFADDPMGNLGMFLVPATILGMTLAGRIMRLTRTMMLEVMRQDYVRTAWAKGLKERVVIMRHALKNALIPVITYGSLQLEGVLGGTVIIENIFVLSGMGRLLFNATQHKDHPLSAGAMLVFAVILVLINLATDLTYAYLDPRIRYK